jgi:hypothetical protein
MSWRRGSDHDDARTVAGAHWITLSNHRRVLLDEEGRILRGLPDTYGGVHVQDVSALGHRMHETEEAEAQCETGVRRRVARTFRTVDDGVRALLEANPALFDFLEQECSHDCDRYRTWIRRGRRGPKPLPGPGDGRFDSLKVPLERYGKRAISSWLEAVYVAIPPSRRWEDFPERLQFLADATGLTLQVPDETQAFAVEREDVERCRTAADERIEALIALARETRLSDAMEDQANDDEETPF